MSRLLVRLSDQKLKDYNWLLPLENIINILPHGSGFDSDWVIDTEDDQFIKLSNSYHAMDGNGFYSGWLHFIINLGRPDFKENEEFDSYFDKEEDYDASQWYHTFEIDFDDSDLDYDDGSEEYLFVDEDYDDNDELTDDAVQRSEDWTNREITAVDKDSLIEYINDTICQALQGITSSVIVLESED